MQNEVFLRLVPPSMWITVVCSTASQRAPYSRMRSVSGAVSGTGSVLVSKILSKVEFLEFPLVTKRSVEAQQLLGLCENNS